VNDKDENMQELIKRVSDCDFWGNPSESKALQTWLEQRTQCIDMNTTREFEIFYERAKLEYILREEI
jgi:hypothetical protein